MPTASKSVTYGSHTYGVTSSGQYTKNGRVISKADYDKYVPSGAKAALSSGTTSTGSSSSGKTSSGSSTSGASGGLSGSSGRTSIGGYSQDYSYDAYGNIYKNGALVPESNYNYLPTGIAQRVANAVQAGSNGMTRDDFIAKYGNLTSYGGNVASDVGSRPANYSGASPTRDEYLQTGVFPSDYYVEEPLYAADLGALISQFQDIFQSAYDGSPESSYMLSKAYQNTLDAIDAAQTQLISNIQGQMSGVDEATLASLKQIRDTVDQNRQALMEEMSRRGLLQSGIWLEMENRLNSGQLSAEQQLLANRLADLQSQLNQALANFGQMRVSAAQEYGLAEQQALQSEAERRQNALQAGLQTAIDLYKSNRDYDLAEWQAKAPYYIETVSEAADRPLRWAELYGETPNYANTDYYSQTGSPSSDSVSVRDYVGNSGKVSWDKNTQSVIVNGQRITPDYIDENGRAYVSRSVLDRILGGY